MSFTGASREQIYQSSKGWRSILQVVISFLATLWMFGQAFLLLLVWILGFIMPELVGTETGMLYSLGLVSGLIGLLVLPSGLTAFFSVWRRPLPKWLGMGSLQLDKIVNLSLIALPVILAAGWLAGSTETLSTALLTPLGILSICIPVLWLINYGQRDLSSGNPQRKWGLFSFSLTINPLLIIVIELIAVFGGLGIFGIWVASNPNIVNILTDLGRRISLAGDDIEQMLRVLQPYLTRPGVIFWVLVAVAGIVPLIEEMFKTLGVWMLSGRKLSPEEGYVTGLLCGAGFALVEGLFNLSSITGGEDWLILVMGRMGSSLLHIFTGGLIGWGLAATWRDGKVFRYIGSYLLSVVIHALWNLLAVSAAFLPMIVFPEKVISSGKELLFYIPLVVLGVVLLTAFIIFTLYIRKQHHQIADGLKVKAES
ncbi:MAG: PrsW family glutamic-type intramembrane protease [Chloroflexota bacterium]